MSRIVRGEMFLITSLYAKGQLLLLLLSYHVVCHATQKGILYEGWHAPAYFGAAHSDNITIEDVVRSNGTMSMSSAAPFNNMSMGFWWHTKPLPGFYCIYRKRRTENVSSCGLPDCPDIESTLRRHADMLTDVGIDFIVAGQIRRD